MKVTYERCKDYILSGVNQRGATLLLTERSLIQYLNMGALMVYFFENKPWNWMRIEETITIPASTGSGDTYHEATLDNSILSVYSICDPLSGSGSGSGSCNKEGSSDINMQRANFCDMGPTDYYIPDQGNLIYLGKGDATRDITLVYYGYNLFTEGEIGIPEETLILPEKCLPGMYQFTLSMIYPHYTEYGNAREAGAYQLAVNYLRNLIDYQTSVVNEIRLKR